MRILLCHIASYLPELANKTLKTNVRCLEVPVLNLKVIQDSFSCLSALIDCSHHQV